MEILFCSCKALIGALCKVPKQKFKYTRIHCIFNCFIVIRHLESMLTFKISRENTLVLFGYIVDLYLPPCFDWFTALSKTRERTNFIKSRIVAFKLLFLAL